MGTGTEPSGGGEANAYSAAPAALGYLAQVEYALLLVLRRLDVELEFDVSIETLDDIVFHDGDNAAELLQSEHRVDRTASLTNSSTDVWKTLHNWIVDGPLGCNSHIADKRGSTWRQCDVAPSGRTLPES